MKHWYLIPLAAVIGLAAGSWGSRSDLEAMKEIRTEKSARKENAVRSGFGAIANLAHIPDRGHVKAVRPAASPTNRTASAVSDAAPASAAPEGRRGHRRGHPRGEDLKARIETAGELWRTRVELARTQWKASLGVGGENERRFDGTVDAMNDELRELMSDFAEEVAEAREVSPELGVRMMNAVTKTLADAYDALGECVERDARGEISKVPLHEFIDPSVIEPMIQVQDYLEPDENGAGGGSR